MEAGAVKLRVMTWLWRQPGGRTQFTATHVNIWAAMIRRHCTLDIELACVTDMPEGVDPGIRIIKPPGFHDDLQTRRWRGGRPSCYRRLAMFAPDAGKTFGRRFVSMDLDVVIGGNIDAILSRTEDVVLCSPSQVGARWVYNGSMVLLKAGSRPRVYTEFTPEKAEHASTQFVGSDQAWLAYALGRGEATWAPRDGVARWGQASEGAMLFFPGNVKPWDALGNPFVAEHYRHDGGRSGLVLGDRRTVWDEARRAMKRRTFDHVIAMPQAASKWPGTVDAVAKDLIHAGALARMLGVDRPVVCGV
jgi:hypothetical protein